MHYQNLYPPEAVQAIFNYLLKQMDVKAGAGCSPTATTSAAAGLQVSQGL